LKWGEAFDSRYRRRRVYWISLVNQLVKAGEAVRVLEQPTADVRHLPIDAIELVRGDIRCAQEVRDAVRDCHQVYHLAANPNLWTRDRSDFDG
jgi:dihydroflavonol-4-reductase